MDKSYEGTIRLGRATATYDREGETVGPDRDASGRHRARRSRAPPPPFAASSSSRRRPTPPRRSAGGSSTRWRARARACRRFPRRSASPSSRSAPLEDGRLAFSIACTSGTYIRSIANELGEKLGCGAHLETLRRTRIGVFSASDAVDARALRGPAAGGAAGGAARGPAGPGSLSVPPHPARLARGLEDPPRPGGPGPRRRRPARATGSRSSDPPTTCWRWARSTRSGTGGWR